MARASWSTRTRALVVGGIVVPLALAGTAVAVANADPTPSHHAPVALHPALTSRPSVHASAPSGHEPTSSTTPAAASPGNVASTSVPVLLVPGYGGTPASMGQLRSVLRHDGWRAAVVAMPDRNRGNLSYAAQVLARSVKATGARQVDVVGYSAGAIVVRTWLKYDAGAALAHRVVLLGAPNQGTQLAAVAAAVDPRLCTPSCMQLLPHSAYLRALNASTLTPRGPSYTSIWSTTDEIITPPVSSYLPGALNIEAQRVCPGDRIAHSQLPHSHVVIGLVAEALAGTLTKVPTSHACAATRARGMG